MPLELDGLPRGRYALHVYPHGKLGRHMTLINEALPLVNTLIDRKDVKVVDLGRIVIAFGAVQTRWSSRPLRVHCTPTPCQSRRPLARTMRPGSTTLTSLRSIRVLTRGKASFISVMCLPSLP